MADRLKCVLGNPDKCNTEQDEGILISRVLDLKSQ